MKTVVHGLALAAVLGLGVVGGAPAALAQTEAVQDKFAADRKAILGMAGTFHVNFDFRETVPWRADYTPIDPKVSGGFEVVRVIEDTGKVIKLQHILVISHDGEVFLVKHWRQDWTYEPASVLEYRGKGSWALKALTDGERRGAWSQTVWQTDDSPRYGGVGRWTLDFGAPRWTSAESWRPLARRDAVRKPVYDRYLGVNRHALTPDGWVHTQDNMKLAAADGTLSAVVQETVINSYDTDTGFQIAKADEYWAKTKGYWAAVRSAWDAAIAKGNGVTVSEEPENGSVTGPKLMGLADDLAKGKKAEAAAIAEAQAVIATNTK
ncbi:DUF6607 family protein [Sphingomonas cavernae]|uniref:Uncharacterized protein n=1 Tax=Sphingomonas cavernae TaxID=2320861 RepID=A0A418WMY4_9SPHN|nr:DUF6607 family protein [Sphingomonas cavernae]RJF91357.1 hypothetical protein D3876_14745 [Sphingomonas cavernae]